MHSLRLSGVTSTGLGRFAAATPGLAAVARGGRRSASMSAAPGMEPPAPHDDVHTTMEDAASHPFGVAYSTRSDEEGFGGVYARDDDDDRPAFSRPTAEASHPPPVHGTSKVKEEEEGLKDGKHAT